MTWSCYMPCFLPCSVGPTRPGQGELHGLQALLVPASPSAGAALGLPRPAGHHSLYAQG